MIKSIQLKNVRCFTNEVFNIHQKNIIITGSNAIGKTTILEAIYLTSITKSHRTNNLKEIIKDDMMFADIKINDEKNEYRIILSDKGKMVLNNQNEIKKISDYIGKFPTVLFSPYDLDIVTGSPVLRRQFLNQEISQINLNYLKQVNLYNKLLHERNACLKELNENSDLTYLKIITKELITVAKPIILARINFLNEVNEVINKYQEKLKINEKIRLIYKPSITIDDLEKVYEEKMLSDIFANVTQYGVHRDELLFFINEKNLSRYGSQGQIRSVILSLKISLCEIIKKYLGNYPILLLDDVLSELDSKRQNNLLNIITGLGQTFITTADTSALMKGNLEKYQIIQL